VCNMGYLSIASTLSVLCTVQQAVAPLVELLPAHRAAEPPIPLCISSGRLLTDVGRHFGQRISLHPLEGGS
jgi:hypothetical protein